MVSRDKNQLGGNFRRTRRVHSDIVFEMDEASDKKRDEDDPKGRRCYVEENRANSVDFINIAAITTTTTTTVVRRRHLSDRGLLLCSSLSSFSIHSFMFFKVKQNFNIQTKNNIFSAACSYAYYYNYS